MICVNISNLFRPISKHKQKYDQLTKTSSCLSENNTKMLGNDEADVSNQMSRKYKEENIRSYLKRFDSLVALMWTLRAGFSVSMYKEQSWVQLLFFVCDLSVSWNSWIHMRPNLKRTITRFIWSSQTGRRKHPGLLRRTTKRPERRQWCRETGNNDSNEDDLNSSMVDVQKKSVWVTGKFS